MCPLEGAEEVRQQRPSDSAALPLTLVVVVAKGGESDARGVQGLVGRKHDTPDRPNQLLIGVKTPRQLG